jgi:hypothetical protein
MVSVKGGGAASQNLPGLGRSKPGVNWYHQGPAAPVVYAHSANFFWRRVSSGER